MCDENEDNGAMQSLKYKMSDVEFDLMLSLYHVAVRLSADVRELSPNDNCTVINEDAARSTVSLSLLSFISILCENLIKTTCIKALKHGVYLFVKTLLMRQVVEK